MLPNVTSRAPAFLLVVAASAATAQVDAPRPPLITARDYPREALRHFQTGIVRVQLVIDPTGRVAGCHVVVSSGFPALDGETCTLLRARARFTPARDEEGKATSDNYVQGITWRIGRVSSDPAWVAARDRWLDCLAAAGRAYVPGTAEISAIADESYRFCLALEAPVVAIGSALPKAERVRNAIEARADVRPDLMQRIVDLRREAEASSAP